MTGNGKNGDSAGDATGYTPPVLATALLDFSDGDFAGAEVRCSLDVSFDTWLRYQGAADTTEAFQARIKHFGEEILVDWNVLDKKGKPRPANAAGMSAIGMTFARMIIGTWLGAIGWVDAPLVGGSPNGRTPAKRKTAPASRSS